MTRRNNFVNGRRPVWAYKSRKQHLTRISTPGGFGQRVLTSHKYNQQGSVASSSAAQIVSQVFRLRSMFDPDSTGTGHQPRGRDDFVAAGYTHYKVRSAAIHVVMTPNATESGYAACTFAVLATGLISPYTVVWDVNELGTNPGGMVIAKKQIPSIENTNGRLLVKLTAKRYLSNVWRQAQRFDFDQAGGPTSSEWEDQNSYTAVGSNPDVNTDVFLELAAFASDPSINLVQGFEYWVTITYYCEWVRLAEPQAS